MRHHHPEVCREPAYAPVLAAQHEAEPDAVARVLAAATLTEAQRGRITERARELVLAVRAARAQGSGLDAFLHEYALSSQEGIVLMCLAEALLRIPDDATRDALIRDKLADADWERHLGRSDSLFVNASTWGLMLSGRTIRLGREAADTTFRRLIARGGTPLIRAAVMQAMRILGRQFVMGRSIGEALARAHEAAAHGWLHSFDMLGESARSGADAERYLASYTAAIHAIGRAAAGRGPRAENGISIKLSALHPRYELAQGARVEPELGERLLALARLAAGHGLNLTVDAEEAERLDLSAALIARVLAAPDLAGWEGFGLAVQAYQTRALPFLDWLAATARTHGRRLMLRLVKGAYWDSEIKRAQERGLPAYPVYTRKTHTDVSYLACAQRLLAAPEVFYPQFATHNAHTAAAVLELAGGRPFEFQRLHGMGEALHRRLLALGGRPCRVYAPVGTHEDLLAYLVRRLLENGANTSFVNRISDEHAPLAELIADPLARVAREGGTPHPRIPLPAALYAPARRNSAGLDLSALPLLESLSEALVAEAASLHTAAPLVAGVGPGTAPARAVTAPADRRRTVGHVVEAGAEALEAALQAAQAALPHWRALPAGVRADALERAADAFEAQRVHFLSLLQREAGKTLADAVSELRETVDFCRYYAAQARALFGAPLPLPGPTGETDRLEWRGRGLFACISPWNFPLAIFTGQISAALAAGNAVLAKPAGQTPLIAAAAVQLLHAAGVPAAVLALLPGDGALGAQLVADARIGGVVFTGSTGTARAIQRSLAAQDGPIVPFIAETGGLNALLVDASALPEQAVEDAITSAFRSAGQRCSAARLLLVQADAAERVLGLLAGAMAELRIGDPDDLATDVGPVIDAAAVATLAAHVERLEREARLVYRCTLPAACAHGSFFAPQCWEIPDARWLQREVFGPLLHVVRYRAADLDRVIDDVNAAGYGLTFGIHTRIDETVTRVLGRIRAGNVYVNRSIIGAVVGTQPFGGSGLSGTGPKAGGPHYLQRFAEERTVCINTTAAGGNAALMTMTED